MKSYRIVIHVDYDEAKPVPSASFLRKKFVRFCCHDDLLSDEEDVAEVNKYTIYVDAL